MTSLLIPSDQFLRLASQDKYETIPLDTCQMVDNDVTPDVTMTHFPRHMMAKRTVAFTYWSHMVTVLLQLGFPDDPI